MKKLEQIGREWLDALVVAISVAMALRSYFYGPFNIPTGSMQPTLYGNHVEECKDPGFVQKSPLRWLEWALTGREYKEFTAPFAGVVAVEPRNDGRFDMSVVSGSGRQGGKVSLPTDALAHLDLGGGAGAERVAPMPWRGGAGVLCRVGRDGENLGEVRVKAGQRLFSGYDATGDFILVNRWRWNMRRPKRGEVMVFNTTGIDKLQQGTHYIKRLTALPGETVQILKPDVYIDGTRIEPLKPARGARGEPVPEPNPGNNGGMSGPVKLGEGEYFACGDNSDNSFDSRYWGPVPADNMRGTGSCVFWPFFNPRWGSIR